MKLPSLFRLPRYSQFNFEPRYYDPIKEEIDQKMADAKRELESPGSAYKSNIMGSFRKRKTEDRASSVNVAVLFVLMLGGVFGYIYYGDVALYYLGGGFLVYLFLRVKKFI